MEMKNEIYIASVWIDIGYICLSRIGLLWIVSLLQIYLFLDIFLSILINKYVSILHLLNLNNIILFQTIVLAILTSTWTSSCWAESRYITIFFDHYCWPIGWTSCLWWHHTAWICSLVLIHNQVWFTSVTQLTLVYFCYKLRLHVWVPCDCIKVFDGLIVW